MTRGRPRTELGTFGEIAVTNIGGRYRASARHPANHPGPDLAGVAHGVYLSTRLRDVAALAQHDGTNLVSKRTSGWSVTMADSSAPHLRHLIERDQVAGSVPARRRYSSAPVHPHVK